MELKFVSLRVGVSPGAAEIKTLTEGDHEVELHAIMGISHGEHLETHHETGELWRPPNDDDDEVVEGIAYLI